MTTQLKSQKPTLKTAQRSITKAHSAPERGQNHVRKSKVPARSYMAVQNNLEQLVAKTKIKGSVNKYERIARVLSKVAGLNNGHVWSWRYVASVHKGSMDPSKKFVRALQSYLTNTELYKKRWCYFSGNNEVLSGNVASIRIEIISEFLKGMGYKPVTYSRYMQIKRLKTLSQLRK